MTTGIPTSLKLEHDKLHTELVAVTKAGGRTGEAAKAVAKVLHPHFIEEEEYALPPLGLLAQLAEGKAAPETADVINMTDRLEVNLPEMLAEHRAIVAALKALTEAAKTEGRPEVARFAEKLMLHAETEEQVSYPTALLVGRYLKNLPSR